MSTKTKISAKFLIRFIIKRLTLILITGIVLLGLWLFYVIYQNIYLTIIAPKEINKNEITAKKQKVNLELFTDISNKIKIKEDVSDEFTQKIENPFQ